MYSIQYLGVVIRAKVRHGGVLQPLATSRRKIERPGALRRICRRLENCKIDTKLRLLEFAVCDLFL